MFKYIDITVTKDIILKEQNNFNYRTMLHYNVWLYFKKLLAIDEYLNGYWNMAVQLPENPVIHQIDNLKRIMPAP